MALDNLISVNFSKEDVERINQAINSINEVLKGKAINLTGEERQQYGSIADRNRVLVDKCKAYMEQAPETIPRTIDKAEFDRDYEARKRIEMPLRDLQRVVEKMTDTKTLLDHDNFQASLTYYRYIKYLASENEAGTTTIYNDLKQHYKGGRPQKEEEKNTTNED